MAGRHARPGSDNGSRIRFVDPSFPGAESFRGALSVKSAQIFIAQIRMYAEPREEFIRVEKPLRRDYFPEITQNLLDSEKISNYVYLVRS